MSRSGLGLGAAVAGAAVVAALVGIAANPATAVSGQSGSQAVRVTTPTSDGFAVSAEPNSLAEVRPVATAVEYAVLLAT
jgi:hypothetical protein